MLHTCNRGGIVRGIVPKMVTDYTTTQFKECMFSVQGYRVALYCVQYHKSCRL